jgi:hypothetical protein
MTFDFSRYRTQRAGAGTEIEIDMVAFMRDFDAHEAELRADPAARAEVRLALIKEFVGLSTEPDLEVREARAAQIESRLEELAAMEPAP